MDSGHPGGNRRTTVGVLRHAKRLVRSSTASGSPIGILFGGRDERGVHVLLARGPARAASAFLALL
jgi:hypothetical protein